MWEAPSTRRRLDGYQLFAYTKIKVLDAIINQNDVHAMNTTTMPYIT
jgi:hypothetical protein